MIAKRPPTTSEHVGKPDLSSMSSQLVRAVFESVAPSGKRSEGLSAFVSESYFRVKERLEKIGAENLRRMIGTSELIASSLVDDLARIFYFILCSERSEEQYDLQLLEQLRHLVNSVLNHKFSQSKPHD